MTPRQALDTLEKALGIQEEELAQALNSSRRTLRSWRTGTHIRGGRHVTSRDVSST